LNLLLLEIELVLLIFLSRGCCALTPNPSPVLNGRGELLSAAKKAGRGVATRV
jgi:hypothetical protein